MEKVGKLIANLKLFVLFIFIEEIKRRQSARLRFDEAEDESHNISFLLVKYGFVALPSYLILLLLIPWVTYFYNGKMNMIGMFSAR